MTSNNKTKYNQMEKLKIHEKYYDEYGFLIVDSEGKPLKNKNFSMFSEPGDVLPTEIIQYKKNFFDLVELEGMDCIRFNITNYGACGCKYSLMDLEEIERLHNFTGRYLEAVKKRNNNST